MTEFERYTSDIAQLISQRRLAIFCGAGVSHSSGLPVVSEVLETLFPWLELSPAEAAGVSAAGIPFERVMEVVLRELPSHASFLELFDLGAPSFFHRFVAALHQRGLIEVVVTTNFDRLLERAIDRAPGDESVEVAIEPAQLVALTKPSSVTFRLIKLHGCVSRPRTMAVQLSMVGSTLLTPARRAALEYVFDSGPHSHVLVTGYSYSDVFDVAPILRSLGGGSKTVLFVNHRGGRGESRPTLEACVCPPGASAFKNWTAAATDTEELVVAIARLLRLPELVASELPADWRPVLTAWLDDCATIAPASRHLAAGALFDAAGMVRIAVGRLTTALAVAERSDDREAIA
jgi:hypothetical protein